MGGLVGRRNELELLGRALARPDVAAVVIAGPAGVGKTRLGLAALALASEAGFGTARVMATRAAAGIPFGAVAQLLPSAGVAPERVDLLRQAVTHVAGLGGDRPLVILIDDAHLLDDASAAFIHQLALSASAFVLTTVRTADERGLTAPDDVPDAIVALWKDGIADRLDLEPLGPEATAELAAMVLEGPLDAGVAAELHRASGGNPLFLHQLIDAGQRAGVLVRVGGRWQIDGRLPLPASLVTAVEERLGTLAPDDRAVLELVAFGEPVPADVLEELAGADGGDRLESLEARGLLFASSTPTGGLDLRLAHPLYAEVLRDRAPGSWSRRARLRLADALEARGPVERDALRIATLRLDAGAAVDPGVALAAATEARARVDLALAERLCRAAIHAGGGFEARLQLCLVLLHAARADEAEQELRELGAVAETDDQIGIVAIARFDGLALLQGQFGEGFRVLADAESRLQDRSWIAETIAHRQYLLTLGGYGAEALTAVDPYAGDPTLSPRATVYTSLAAGLACFALGRVDDALTHIHRGAAALDALPWMPTIPEPSAFDDVEALTLLLDGRLDEARTLAVASNDQAVATGSETSRGGMELCLAQIERVAGRPATGAGYAAAAMERFAVRAAPPLTNQAAAELAIARSILGDTVAARELLSECDTATPGARRPLLAVAEAWCSAVGGDLATAADLLTGVIAIEPSPSVLFRALALSDLARLGAARHAAPLLAELVARVEGDLVPALARHAAAVVAGTGDALRAAAEHLDALGVRLVAAEAATAAAVAYERSGHRAGAVEARELADRLLGQCERAATPGIVAAGVRAVLSRREHEVAALAAGGLANRDIAERLGLSKRTVDSQLQRVYEKLGLAGRSELRGALGMERTS